MSPGRIPVRAGRRGTGPGRGAATAGEVAAARQVASLLLDYPQPELIARLPLLRATVAPLPGVLAGPLGRFLDHVETTPLDEQQAAYVETFDLRRRCSLYLTYYRYGDTRKRGMALLQFKHLYGRAGMTLEDGELPDHLAVVLEFTAVGDVVRGERLLHEHRAGLELIRLALEQSGSPHRHVIHAVCATLPAVAAADHAAVLQLAQEGPPSEEVGLDPYGAAPFAPPEFTSTPRPPSTRPSAQTGATT